jgi:hypothetical protein
MVIHLVPPSIFKLMNGLQTTDRLAWGAMAKSPGFRLVKYDLTIFDQME